MGTVGTWALFAVFGGVCALYVSVVGFVLSALAIVLLLGLVSLLFGGVFTVWTLVIAFVALQVGYFVGLIGSTLFRHVSRLSAKDPREVEEGDLTIKHD